MSGAKGVSGPGLALLLSAVLLAGGPSHGQESDGSGVYATVGLGVLSVGNETGIGVPLGMTWLSTRHHFLVTVAPLDLGMLEGEDADPRYYRAVDAYGQRVCVDRSTGMAVSFYECSGGTDVRRSASAEVNVLPVETLIVAGKPAKLHLGLGFRWRGPRTAYGTVGMFAATRSGTSIGARVAMGRDFIFLGVGWGVNLRRALGGWQHQDRPRGPTPVTAPSLGGSRRKMLSISTSEAQ